ncbi:light-regulated signal transduction histidine kinase (bacteriophytochrome) [Pedobacter cryoconitis]|uniref:GAF domain-containing protein n=1 Tax=Pedobacter cryoconitis TaxID=188932 RepID=UPI00160B380D|nr:GAF domain-containing protein [Pedobacter cryoconitis]MBB6274130.1 light-regulated signal transduction histidine kinase (bacteriophytochrome) [Pedobacter cryoconitis]
MTDKKNFDSDFCGSIPLHHINSTQDYGYLLVLDKKLNIIQLSENVSGLLESRAEDLINKNIADFIQTQDLAKIEALLKKGISKSIPLYLQFNKQDNTDLFLALLHIKADYIIIELEKQQENSNRSFADVFQEIKYISTAIDQADSVQEVCDIAIHELRKLSGFDGVLMYRFDTDWNGTVIAEEKDERLERYLGQTFPASDVPKQARQMYLKNTYRLIPNRDFEPVRLYPVINPVTNAFIDLSDCNLRSVAKVHLEYMKNMNVKASMSIRVIYNETLWGLISCHHLEPKYIGYELCSIFEWLSEVISTKISLILNKQDYRNSKQIQQKRVELSDQVYAYDDITAGLFKDDEQDILHLLNASGALISINGRSETKGEVPDRNDLFNLTQWLESKNLNTVYSTNSLASLFEDAGEYSNSASGLLFIPINNVKGDFLMCFRREAIEDINWGGDPNQAINFTADGKKYHPRNSFENWKQTVYKQALPWNKHELEVAESLRSFLFEFAIKQSQQ